MLRPRIAGVLIVLSPLLLCGCASAGGGPATVTATATVTRTTTATVTETPVPTAAPRSYDDAITAFDAWEICYGAAFGSLPSGSTLPPYDPGPVYGGYAVTDKGDGTFDVLVGFAPPEGFGGQIICNVGGTVGAPVLQGLGGRDFG